MAINMNILYDDDYAVASNSTTTTVEDTVQPNSGNLSGDMDQAIMSILLEELKAFEGADYQDYQTGRINRTGRTFEQYSNRLLGAPFQFMDSVDGRFEGINTNVGVEYLKNILLNSPILYIKPGVPKYTGKDEPGGFLHTIKNVAYLRNSGEDASYVDNLLNSLVQSVPFGSGNKLQKRMFGINPTYLQYMRYVNYMCRSVATLMGLDVSDVYPQGTFTHTNTGMTNFSVMDWQNYRMDRSAIVREHTEYVGALVANSWPVRMIVEVLPDGVSRWLGYETVNPEDAEVASEYISELNTAWQEESSAIDVRKNKIETVMFMVEPGSFSESFSNTTAQSMIEAAIDKTSDIGSELAFITNSKVDLGPAGSAAQFVGELATGALDFLAGAIAPLTGGFLHNLVSGALGGLKGQKMIYPEIYKSSNSEMNYQFTVNLVSPYGDAYNYYMNIVVPLCHLICLVGPKMMSSNSIAAPFLVQAFIPGMATCEMGIISSMQISKNPSDDHVSVNGYPLSVRVTFTIKELYNALAISPSNDPASFLFNQTLNDYMAVMAGVVPSLEINAGQMARGFAMMRDYLSPDNLLNELLAIFETRIEAATMFIDTIGDFFGFN